MTDGGSETAQDRAQAVAARDRLLVVQQRWKRAIAAVLVALRTDTQLEQEEVAAGLGIHRNLVGRTERGKRDMTLIELALFARVVKRSPAEIIELMSDWAMRSGDSR